MAVSGDLYADLSILYENQKQTNFLYSQAYVEGCLMGACACPEIPLPDVWLPWVIKHHQQIENAQQADFITSVLFGFFKQCLVNMHNNTLNLPAYAVYEDQAINEDHAAHEDHTVYEDHTRNGDYTHSNALSEWCQGMLMAHTACEDVWQAAWDKMQANSGPDIAKSAPMLAKDLKHCLLMFTTFANPKDAIQEANNKDGSGEALAKKLSHIAKSLPDALSKYVSISGELATYLPNQFETFQKTTR